MTNKNYNELNESSESPEDILDSTDPVVLRLTDLLVSAIITKLTIKIKKGISPHERVLNQPMSYARPGSVDLNNNPMFNSGKPS